MFRKVHMRLTLLCLGITVLILAAMSCGWLYISERSLRSSSFISFENDMNTLIGNIERQTRISEQWLQQMEDNGKYQIWLFDNGIPFLHNGRNAGSRSLYEEALALYQAGHGNAVPGNSGAGGSSSHREFTFWPEEGGPPCHVSGASLARSQGQLQVLILAPLNALEEQIHRQRLLFLGLDLGGAAALALFAWHFTGRLLLPLEENQKRQIRFVASASHELRTPLAVILSCISAARKAEPDQSRRFLDSAETESRRMSRLIEDMLLLSRENSAAWNIRLAPAEADTLLLELYEAFLPLANRKQLRLSIRLPEESLPPCLCDSQRIRQALSILLDNALCYTPAGGQVELALSRTRGGFCFSVADNGPGIPETEKKLVFERFYRADAARSGQEHFGLGLCIASEITQAHHGRLRLYDTPGGGSTFQLELPFLSGSKPSKIK